VHCDSCLPPSFSLLPNSRDRRFRGDSFSGGDAAGSPPASGRLSGTGGCGEPWSRRPASLLAFRLAFLIFLGLGFLLSSAAYGLEAVAGGSRAARCGGRCGERARTPQGVGFVAPSSSAVRSGRGLRDVVRQGGRAFDPPGGADPGDLP
jgi:hypothetical protein